MKKFFSVLMCSCLLLLSMSTIAMASYNESLIITTHIEDSWIVDVKGENQRIEDTVDKKFYQQGNDYSVTYNCYQYLDEAQKVMYDSILANYGKLNFTIYFEDGVFLYSNFVKDYFTKVMNALCTDRPDLFYYAGFSIDGGQLHYNGTYVESIDYVVGVYDSEIYTETNLPGYYEALKAAVPKVPVDNTNRYLFVKSVHDYLAQTVYYPDLETTDYVMSSHDAYGALVEGRAVCQGYSDAFKLICDYYKIPCVCISGTSNGGGHMWNAVQMDDGKWYFIDATWDDQTEKATARIYYDFFLIGNNTMDIYFGGEVFSESHVPDSDLLLPLLNYATDKYSQTNHFTGFKATYNSLAIDNGNYLIRSCFDIEDTYVYYNGIYVETNNPVTNATFKVPSGDENNLEDWTLVLLGDCNSDGNCDASDYADAVNKVLADTGVSDASDMAADMDCDGYLDVIDLAMIQLATSGLNTQIEIE